MPVVVNPREATEGRYVSVYRGVERVSPSSRLAEGHRFSCARNVDGSVHVPGGEGRRLPWRDGVL
eukprot:3114229-Pyramimonas_sp.AAC.1